MIKPSEETVAKMISESFGELGPSGLTDPQKLSAAFADFAHLAAQWGADKRIQEVCEWLDLPQQNSSCKKAADLIYPLLVHFDSKLPSLKEKALEALKRFDSLSHRNAGEMMEDFDVIRSAIDSLV